MKSNLQIWNVNSLSHWHCVIAITPLLKQVKKRDSSEAYFSDKELRVLEEIGVLQVLSYVYNDSLERAILDLIKAKDREKNRKIGRDRVYALVGGSFRRA